MAALSRPSLGLLVLAGCLSTPAPPYVGGDGGTGDGGTGDIPCADDPSAVFPYAAVFDDPDHAGFDRLVRGGTCQGKPTLLVYDPVPGDTFSLASPRRIELPPAIGELRAIGTGRPGALVALVADSGVVQVFDVSLSDGVAVLLVTGTTALGTAPAWVAGTPVTASLLFGAGTRFWHPTTSSVDVVMPGAYNDIASALQVVTAHSTVRGGVSGWTMSGPITDFWLAENDTNPGADGGDANARIVSAGGGLDGRTLAPLSIAVRPDLSNVWTETPMSGYTRMISTPSGRTITSVGATTDGAYVLLAVVDSNGSIGAARLAPGATSELPLSAFSWSPPSIAPTDALLRVGHFDAGLPQVHAISPQAGAKLDATNAACQRSDVAGGSIAPCT